MTLAGPSARRSRTRIPVAAEPSTRSQSTTTPAPRNPRLIAVPKPSAPTPPPNAGVTPYLARLDVVELVERLLDVEVWGARAELTRDRPAHGTLGIVGRDDSVVSIGHRGELSRAPQPTKVQRFGLQDVDRVVS